MIILESKAKFQEMLDERTLNKTTNAREYVVKMGEDTIVMGFRWPDRTPVRLILQPENLLIWAQNTDVYDYAKDLDGTAKEQLFEFFINISSRDLHTLENIEDRVMKLDEKLFENTTPDKENFHKVHELRKEVWGKKRYFEKMEILTDELAQNEEYFLFIDKKYDKLLSNILRIQEYLEQIRQAYEAQIDIEQNNLMKFFTVVTSIFLPLSLIAGWYGMNLIMPEVQWIHGYPLVIGLSVAIVVIMIVIFHKKKWL